MISKRPEIKKLGTIDCDIVETTPIVFEDKLFRFEYIRKRYYGNATGESFFRFIDVEAGKTLPAFGKGYHLGSAFVEGDTVYVFAVNQWGGSEIRTFFSKDLVNWESYTNILLCGFEIYNNSVCKNSDGKFIMLIEVRKPLAETPFTPLFLKSDDLLTWRLLPNEYTFGKDIYTGGHFLTFESGYYYLTYLHLLPGPEYETYIVRSRDLKAWEESPLNPFLSFSEEDDKKISNSELAHYNLKRIGEAQNTNASDIEFCEYQGKTVIYYSWGNQLGAEFLAEAVYEGSSQSLVEGFFPD
jgi:alpha-L-fucosidase